MYKEIKKICCIGAGYVGGPTMAVIADKCPDIIINVVDLNEVRIGDWNNDDFSRLPVFEPGLTEIIKRRRGVNLFFSTQIEKNIASADMIFISVNTPIKQSGVGAGKASDLKWIESSARQISKYAKGFTIVVEKSTLPVRTANTIKKILEVSNPHNKSSNKENNKYFKVLSNPEFLSEGSAINDLENPDRVLIGGEDEDSINALKRIYLNWVDESQIITTNLWSSELSKLTANAFLAQRISSINSISALCEKTGADVKEVALAVGLDSRIGNKFLNVGPGFGGSCFKKDLLNLIYICDYYGLTGVSSYWQKVIDINNWQRNRISRIVVEKLFGTLSGKKIGILGFAFKANTNDTRESPAIEICKDLIEEGAKLQIYDPKVSFVNMKIDLNNDFTENLSNKIEGWELANSIEDAANNADALIVLTEWKEFKTFDWMRISKLMRAPSWFFDTRLITDTEEATKYGINIWKIGKDF